MKLLPSLVAVVCLLLSVEPTFGAGPVPDIHVGNLGLYGTSDNVATRYSSSDTTTFTIPLDGTSLKLLSIGEAVSVQINVTGLTPVVPMDVRSITILCVNTNTNTITWTASGATLAWAADPVASVYSIYDFMYIDGLLFGRQRTGASGGRTGNPNQFDDDGSTLTITNIYGVAGASLWTNDVGGTGNYHPNEANYGIEGTNWYHYGTTELRGDLVFKHPLAVTAITGSNTIDTTLVSLINITGPTATASDTTIYLEYGVVGQYLILKNYGTNSAFTLVDGGTTVSNPDATVRLRGDWTPTEHGESLHLMSDGIGWDEVGRQSNGGGGNGTVLGSGTTPRFSYWTSSTTLGSGALYHVAADKIGVGSLTNILHPNLSNLVYTNAAASPNFIVAKGDGALIKLGLTTGSHGIVLGGSGSNLYLGANNNGSGDFLIQATSFTPTSDGTDDLGGPIARWDDFYVDQIILTGITKVQKTALTPTDGMMVYQTDNTPGLRAYVNGAWVMVSTVADP